MQSGWIQFIKRRFSSASEYDCLGIHFCTKGLSISAFKKQGEQLAWTLQHFIPLENWPSELSDWVGQNKLINIPTYAFLSAEHYELVQVDKPSVADDEIVQALRWSIKDITTIEGDLAVDYFDLPAQSAGGNKINVVACKSEVIKKISDGLNSTDLSLQQISVAELAICDLMANYSEPCVSVVQESGQNVYLNIVKDGQLYFSRRLRGYDNLKSFSPNELKMGSIDNLTLEVQRSMDYFESQLRQAPIRKIVVNLETAHPDTVCEIMRELTQIDVEPLSYAFDIGESIEDKESFHCALAASTANTLLEGRS